jgi:hypothetical protein
VKITEKRAADTFLTAGLATLQSKRDKRVQKLAYCLDSNPISPKISRNRAS